MPPRTTGAVRLQAALAAVAGVAAVAALVRPDWIELVPRMDPDRGSGAFEWAIVASLLAISTTTATVARRAARHARC